jgi:DNA-binding HxlR family transcriptional regulator
MSSQGFGENSCPLARLLRALGGKWALPVVYVLAQAEGPMRFSELHRALAPITESELARQLREFERMGLVTRTVFAEVPPRVEYAPSALCASMREPLNGLARWGEAHSAELAAMAAE